jgi:hypothetical protein
MTVKTIKGFREGLGDKAAGMIVVEISVKSRSNRRFADRHAESLGADISSTKPH